MSDEVKVDGEKLQFDKAEFKTEDSGAKSCAVCRKQIADSYYEVNGNVSCPECKVRIEEELAKGSPMLRFLKALIFGAVAAIAGSVIWFAVAKLLNLEVGLIAILVGFMVGWSVKKGSEGRGGMGYQFLAIFLTYFSVATAYAALIYSDPSFTQSMETLPVIVRIITAFISGVTLPFLAGFENILGLLIIGFGLYEAWMLCRCVKMRITGPYQLAMQAPAAAQTGI